MLKYLGQLPLVMHLYKEKKHGRNWRIQKVPQKKRNII